MQLVDEPGAKVGSRAILSSTTEIFQGYQLQFDYGTIDEQNPSTKVVNERRAMITTRNVLGDIYTDGQRHCTFFL